MRSRRSTVSPKRLRSKHVFTIITPFHLIKHFNLIWQRHRNFSVDKLNKAKRIATIKNLKTIFGSFHPDI